MGKAPVMRTVNRPNRQQWKVGDIVIADRDAKEHKMLRLVIAILPGGLIRTRFAFRHELPKGYRDQVFRDRPEALHSPRRFGIKIEKQRRAA